MKLRYRRKLLLVRSAVVAAALFVALSRVSARQQTVESPPDTLAIVGPEIITARDLSERLELMPWVGKGSRHSMDSVKIDALNALVAEKLLALKGLEMHLSEDSATQMMRWSLERLLARDELYRREVLDKITFEPEEVSEGLKRYARELRIRMVITESEAKAEQIRTILDASPGSESGEKSVPTGLIVAEDTLDVRFGRLDPQLEDRAYALREGVTSEPFYRERYGWILLQLVYWNTDPDYAEESIQNRRISVQNILKMRKRDIRAVQYFLSTLGHQSARVEPKALQLLADTLRSVIVADSAHRFVSGHYRSLPADLEALRGRLSGNLEMAIVRIPGDDLTIGEALEGLRYQAFLFRSLQRRDFVVEVNEMLKKIVEGELLARVAFRKHLQNTPAVRRDLNLWSEYWAANALATAITDTIRPREDDVAKCVIGLDSTFARSNFVNIREIFSNSLRLVLDLFLRVQKGESMALLARQYSERKEWATNGGESGFFAIADHPAIGIAAIRADSGSSVGPLETEGKYSFFQVLGKRSWHRAQQVLDSLWTDAKEEILARQQVDALERYIAAVSKEFGVQFRYDNLRRLHVNPLQMVTKRLIGFGGAIPAAPPLAPLTGWAKGQAKVNPLFQ